MMSRFSIALRRSTSPTSLQPVWAALKASIEAVNPKSEPEMTFAAVAKLIGAIAKRIKALVDFDERAIDLIAAGGITEIAICECFGGMEREWLSTLSIIGDEITNLRASDRVVKARQILSAALAIAFKKADKAAFTASCDAEASGLDYEATLAEMLADTAGAYTPAAMEMAYEEYQEAA